MAREKAKDQLQKRDEIRKKVIEEKYSDELKKMQVDAGLLPPSALNRMEWMHSAHDTAEGKNSAEEYLLGKAVSSLAETQGALKPMLYNPDSAENQANEDFVRIIEDPMYLMEKEMEKRRRETMANPVKMRDILEEVKELQRIKAERKKAKKAKKDKKKKESKRSRSRSKSRDKKNNKHKDDKKKKRKGSKSSSRSASPSSSISDSRRHKKDKKDRKEKRDKKDKKRKEDSTSAGTDEDQMFNEYVTKRLGPLVEFDPETYRLKFTAKYKFKTNEKTTYTQEERDKMVAQMQQDAEVYERTKMKKYEKDLKDEEKTEKQQGAGGYLRQIHKEAMDEAGRNSLGDNISRGKFFHDKKLAKGD